MKKIKCITFDKEAQNNIPKEIREKMRADRRKAESKKYMNDCLIQDSCMSFETNQCNKNCKLYL